MPTDDGGLRKLPGSQRTLPAEETIARALPLARTLGVTRLTDITGLDRVGIPTWSAIVPKSEDLLSVYNGKGLRHIDAKAGALMEAIERQTALRARLPLIVGSYEELRRTHELVDPRELKETLSPDYAETRTYAWVEGEDLLSQRKVLVPASYAGYFWKHLPHPPCFAYSSSNGISAGNVREEAICQALCELIERDAWTLAELAGHVLPWVRHRMASPGTLDSAVDDFEAVPSLELDGDPGFELLKQAGLLPVLHDITSDLAIPTVYAAIADETIPGYPMVHGGLGTHPDAAVAARRALTEAAQSRCVDIQGIREDIDPADRPATRFNLHSRRVKDVNRRQWHLGYSRVRKRLEDLPSVANADIGDDLQHILARMRACAIGQVVVVDFTPPDAAFPVVRAIVPELEAWSVNKGPLGRRALHYWRSHV
ncbi:MAG TPA: YcaO-like family protein [Acidobacteriaceae bacterium]|nr:YcaO-like family protein [Acidobacteriaceae bacterium]